jgi:uncharacterized protein
MAYDHDLTDDEKRELLRIARATLKEFLLTGRVPPGAPHRKSLTDPAGVFVSLSEGGKPRGAIGSLSAERPIFKMIQEMAVAAASRDPRAKPVKIDELEAIVIEISVIGPESSVKGPGDIEVGRHGISVAARGKRAILLPQAIVAEGWTSEQALAKTAEKAGLPADAWQDADAQLAVFTAQVFDETKLKRPA